MPRVLVVGRKPGRVCRLCDLGADNFLERVDALASGVEGVHEMHLGRSSSKSGSMAGEVVCDGRGRYCWADGWWMS